MIIRNSYRDCLPLKGTAMAIRPTQSRLIRLIWQAAREDRSE